MRSGSGVTRRRFLGLSGLVAGSSVLRRAWGARLGMGSKVKPQEQGVLGQETEDERGVEHTVDAGGAGGAWADG
jgi:hypothetical protein